MCACVCVWVCVGGERGGGWQIRFFVFPQRKQIQDRDFLRAISFVSIFRVLLACL